MRGAVLDGSKKIIRVGPIRKWPAKQATQQRRFRVP